jgi:putative acetyltransferase
MTAPPITIRRATTQDAAAFARIMGDPSVLPNLMQVPYTSEELWKTRLAELLTPGKGDMVLVAERDGRVVGTAGLHATGPALRRRHVMMLGISVAQEAQGQGVGRALMQALCSFADEWGQVLRLELQVYADNDRAIALYERFGFVREGLHHGYALRAGEYVDSVSMARLHPRPPCIVAREAP